MERQALRLYGFLVFFGLFQLSSSRAVIEILFMRYQASCTEDAGTSKCDPKFTFCLKRDTDPMSISSCYYGSAGESSHYQDTNDIDFSYRKDVGGIPNPWIIPLTKDPGPKILFVIRIRDDDIFGDDHLQTWGTNLTEVVYPSKDIAVFSNRSTSSGGYTMKFRIRIYCDANYFSSNCSTYCKVQDSAAGHFSCDPITGTKVCAKGWTGVNCTEDINECSQQICETGTCENLVGDYICHCPPHYMGKNCSVVENLCASNPCLHNGTCTFNNVTFTTNCTCLKGYDGNNCEWKNGSCQSSPCLNGATCVSNSDDTSYSCQCVYPYSGGHCEFISSTTIWTTPNQSYLSTTVPTTSSWTTTPTTEQLRPSSNSTSNATVGGNIIGSDDSSKGKNEDFKLWYIIVICVGLVIIVVIILACIIWRHRDRKEKKEKYVEIQSENGSTNNLAFGNSLYNTVSLNPQPRTQRQLSPLPTTPSEDDQFNPPKPFFNPEGAVGGAYADMDADGYVKPREITDVKSSELLERAKDNPYQDFNTLNTKLRKQASEESPYQDLDEVKITLDGLVGQSSTDSVFLNEPDGEGMNPYSDVPNNLPRLVIPPFTIPDFVQPVDDDVDNIPYMNAPDPPTFAPQDVDSIGPFEPVPEPVETENSPQFRLPERPYAEIPVRFHNTNDPFAAPLINNEDELQDIGLPVLGGTECGYDTPKILAGRQFSLAGDEAGYKQPFTRSSLPSDSSEYDSPRSLKAKPPSVLPKPKGSKPCYNPSESFENAAFDRNASEDNLLPFQLDSLPEQGQNFHGVIPESSDVDEESEGGVTKPPPMGFYVENYAFSRD
ncbi:uncharacterized protein LOC131955651 [Physella acuta]|uniref:uncharacterized protein LOC131955651 n=1 Tax=Physella acuta TaxID=109671 RepID=UPI0027DD97A9|nr:uncharacterized protein LOC131955651 [Physella acuta]